MARVWSEATLFTTHLRMICSDTLQDILILKIARHFPFPYFRIKIDQGTRDLFRSKPEGREEHQKDIARCIGFDC